MTASRESLRKAPQQERSRRMVERIVEAGRAVLLEDGLERATTNRIASRAGVSPGSLYQYFPDKDAVLTAVVERYSTEIEDELTAVLADHLDLPPTTLVRVAYAGLLDVLERHREYVRLVTRELPRSRTTEHLERMERRIGELVGAYLRLTRTPTRLSADATAWLLVRLVEHLSVQYVLEPPELSREAFVDELVHLTTAHLAVQ